MTAAVYFDDHDRIVAIDRPREFIREIYPWMQHVLGKTMALRSLTVYGRADSPDKIPDERLNICAARFIRFAFPNTAPAKPIGEKTVVVKDQISADIARLKMAERKRQRAEAATKLRAEIDKWDWFYWREVRTKDSLIEDKNEMVEAVNQLQRDFGTLDDGEALAADYNPRWVAQNWHRPGDEVIAAEKERVNEFRDLIPKYFADVDKANADFECEFARTLKRVGVDFKSYADYCDAAIERMTVGNWANPCARGLVELDLILNGSKRHA